MENREAWCAAVHGVTKCQTQLSDWTTTCTQSPLAKTGTFCGLQSRKETSLAGHRALRTESVAAHTAKNTKFTKLAQKSDQQRTTPKSNNKARREGRTWFPELWHNNNMQNAQFSMKKKKGTQRNRKIQPNTGRKSNQKKPSLRKHKHWTYWTKTLNKLLGVKD